MAHKIKGLGWRRGFNDPRDYTPEHPEVKKILQSAAAVSNNKKGEKLDTADLPKTIDNRRYCTPIEDQGNLGSCTANAGVGLYEYMEKKALGKYMDGSRLFLYKATRLLMGQEGIGDSGAYIRTTLGAIRLFGIPDETYWPYTDKDPEFDRMPDAWLWAFAQNFQSMKQFRVDNSPNGDENIQRMKEYVAKGFALDFGFQVFVSREQAKRNGGVFPYPSPNEEFEGGHCVLIVGYDDDKISKNEIDSNTQTGCFLVRNSWGETWGEGGYGWIPYEYFRPKYNGDVLADDVWTIAKLEWLETGQFYYQ